MAYIAGTAMDLNKPAASLTPEQQREVGNNLARTKRYQSPRRVWVEDGHVFLEDHEGEVVSMTPDVALKLGRMLSEAGSDSIVNHFNDQAHDEAQKIDPTDRKTA